MTPTAEASDPPISLCGHQHGFLNGFPLQHRTGTSIR
jgi:hypothetical protein